MMGNATCYGRLISRLRKEDFIMKKKNGFTLIELSIVLVIIGLLVGGVLAGQDMYEMAKARALMSQIEKTETAFRTFQLKYNCLAGDCKNANSFGLGSSGNGDKAIGLAGAGLSGHPWYNTSQGCVSGGSGNYCMTINNAIATSFITNSALGEMQWFWVHLSKAGLIEEKIDALSAPVPDNDDGLAQYFPKAKSGKSYLMAMMWNNKLYIRTGFMGYDVTNSKRVTLAQGWARAQYSSLTGAQMRYIHEKLGYDTIISGESANMPLPALQGQKVFASDMYTNQMPTDPYLPANPNSWTQPAYRCITGHITPMTYHLTGRCDLLWEIYER